MLAAGPGGQRYGVTHASFPCRLSQNKVLHATVVVVVAGKSNCAVLLLLLFSVIPSISNQGSEFIKDTQISCQSL